MPFLSGELLQNLIERADAKLSKLENSAFRRLDKALLQAFFDLEQQLKTLYIRAKTDTTGEGAALREARARVLIGQVAALLEITSKVGGQSVFDGLVNDAYQLGVDNALEIITRYTGAVGALNLGVPVEAIAQATNASERLKQHGKEFAVKAEAAIINGLVQGQGFNTMAKNIREAVGVTRSKALVIARTEVITANDAARRDSYKELLIDLVIRVATQDVRVCGWCAARAGLVYAREKAPAALHPQDRCYNVPFTRQWLEKGLVDVDWYKNHRSAVAALALSQGQVLRRGAAPFEKANGLEPPKALWSPEGGWL